jgi:hypothetical protein
MQPAPEHIVRTPLASAVAFARSEREKKSSRWRADTAAEVFCSWAKREKNRAQAVPVGVRSVDKRGPE